MSNHSASVLAPAAVSSDPKPSLVLLWVDEASGEPVYGIWPRPTA